MSSGNNDMENPVVWILIFPIVWVTCSFIVACTAPPIVLVFCWNFGIPLPHDPEGMFLELGFTCAIAVYAWLAGDALRELLLLLRLELLSLLRDLPFMVAFLLCAGMLLGAAFVCSGMLLTGLGWITQKALELYYA